MNSLDQKLYSIGIQIAGDFENRPKFYIDIEQTLIEACYEIDKDGRLLSLVMGWVKIHGNYIIAEKLIKNYKLIAKEKGETPWFNALLAFASLECSHKFSKWVKKEKKKVFWQSKEITENLIALKGAVPFWESINIYVALSSFRIRERDVLSPKELIKFNYQYRNRYIYGPSWRADIITMIERGINTPTAIAKTLGCSYEPANRVFREYSMAIGY